MRLTITRPRPSQNLRVALVACWAEVTNAGGAVGFRPPVTAAEVTPMTRELLDRVAAGQEHLLVARADGALIGWVCLLPNTSPVTAHWATVRRLQVRPIARGQGVATRLMEEVHTLARDELDLEALHLTVRGDHGLEPFYERLGYQVAGRLPRALRFEDGSTHDEVTLVLALTGPG